MTQSGMIARQPILLANGHLYAYELLYRNSSQNFATVLDDNQATSSVLVNALTTFGLSKLIGDKIAFINVGKDLLMNPILEIIPKERFVLEILEDVVVDESIIERVKYLRELGYTIAIDDLNFEPQMLENFKPLLEMVQVLKFDIAQTGLEQLKEQLDFFVNIISNF
jgi:EAL and modified HD-GYP domain-containing signal transduction protein